MRTGARTGAAVLVRGWRPFRGKFRLVVNLGAAGLGVVRREEG